MIIIYKTTLNTPSRDNKYLLRSRERLLTKVILKLSLTMIDFINPLRRSRATHLIDRIIAGGPPIHREFMHSGPYDKEDVQHREVEPEPKHDLRYPDSDGVHPPTRELWELPVKRYFLVDSLNVPIVVRDQNFDFVVPQGLLLETIVAVVAPKQALCDIRLMQVARLGAVDVRLDRLDPSLWKGEAPDLIRVIERGERLVLHHEARGLGERQEPYRPDVEIGVCQREDVIVKGEDAVPPDAERWGCELEDALVLAGVDGGVDVAAQVVGQARVLELGEDAAGEAVLPNVVQWVVPHHDGGTAVRPQALGVDHVENGVDCALLS